MIPEVYIQKIEEIVSSSNITSLGLMEGEAGVCLFYAELYKHFKEDKYYNKLLEHLNNILEGISSEKLSFRFSDGIPGIIWMLNYLEKEEIIESIEEIGLSELNESLYSHIENDFKINNWDYLHGGLGVLLGFYEKDIFALKLCINYLDDTCIIEDDGSIKWHSELYNHKINLGLAHGIPSIIYFLLKGLAIDELYNKSHKLLEGAIKMILKQEQNFEQKGYCFDSFIGDNYKSRLAWCYGDLSIAYLLYNAGKSLKNSELVQRAIKIAETTTTRRELKDTFSIDACLCHGSTGLYLMYKKFYTETCIDVFNEASDFWLEQTKVLLDSNDFTFYNRYNNNWENNFSFLEGLSGVGLTLLFHIRNEDSAWDKCLLLS
jgi:lantibiotic modifying enzyme